MKYLNIILSALMVLFAAVQYNDPDVILWFVIYFVPAIWAGLAAFRLGAISANIPFNLLRLCLVAEVIGAVYYWPITPGFWRQAVWWETETAREGMGIMIATIVVAVAFLTVLRARTKAAEAA